MNTKITFRVALLVLLLITVGVAAAYLSINSVQRQSDAFRLGTFAKQIGGADRIVVTAESVRLTFKGDEAQRIVRAISSAVPARMPDAELALKYSQKATFYQGTRIVGDMALAGNLFILKNSPALFADGSGTLDAVVSTPLYATLRESYRTNH